MRKRSPEEDLVLAACRTAVGGDVDLSLARTVDTHVALSLAGRLGVAGVVGSQLTAFDPAWQSALSDNLARNLHLLDRTQVVQRALSVAGVPSLVLKGLPLSRFGFGSIAIRQCADIDLLVSQHQFASAVRTMEQGGFVALNPIARIAKVDVRLVHAVTFLPTGAESQFAVDLHWIVPLPTPLSGAISAGWLERAQRNLSGSTDELPSVGPEELCLHAIVHWLQHGPILKTLTDMAACRRSDHHSWSVAMRRAERDGWGDVARIADREVSAFVDGRPSTLPFRVGAVGQLLRNPQELSASEVFAARAVVMGRPRAVLSAAIREMRFSVTHPPDDAGPAGHQLRRALTRAPRALWRLGRFAVQLARS